MIDLTTLEGADTPGKVRSLCAKARVPDPPTRPPPPGGDLRLRRHGRHAREALGDSGIHVAAVATAFPSGRASMPVKLADTRDAVAAGADEIDMVIDRGAFLAGDYLTVFNEIAAVKEACAPRPRRPPQGHHGDRRAGHLRQRPPRVVPVDAGRRRLHQDVHRQGAARRDPARHARSCSRRSATGASSPACRSASSRPAASSTSKDAHQVPRHGQRDRRRRLARPGLVPLRRVQPAQRPSPAAAEARAPAPTPAPTT